MTLSDIYATYTAGSQGFVAAVQTHCGFCASNDEVRRIADRASDADEFQRIWENDDSWTDAKNAAE